MKAYISSPEFRRRTANKWLVLVFIVALLFWLWYSGVFALLTDAEWLQQRVEEAGWMAPLVYLLVMGVAFPFGSGGLVVLLSGAIWPLPLAFLYASISAVLVSWAAFEVARRTGRDWVASRIPPKIKAYEEKMEAHPRRSIVILRLILWINPALDALVGLSTINRRTYLVVSTTMLLVQNLLAVLLVTYGIDAF